MTQELSPQELVAKINQGVPRAEARAVEGAVMVEAASLVETARFLAEDPELRFDFLAAVTGVDYPEGFQVVYHLTSIEKNHQMVLKVMVYDRQDPVVPSVTPVWRGADFQEREVYDLMGIAFEGHPNMKRILLWEGFAGHPLRKDFLDAPRQASVDETGLWPKRNTS